MANRALYVLVAVAGIGLASGAGWWFQNRSSGAPAQGASAAAPAPRLGNAGGPPSVEVTRVKTMPLQDDAQAVGSLKSRQSVTIKPETAGRVARIAFADGAQVRRGQLLVQLDDTLQRAELSQAQAQLSIARANLKRNQELVAQNFVAQRVVEESQANLQVAEAQVALADARMQRMRIAAPFDGTLGLRSITLGQYVGVGDSLVNLEDTSQLTVDFRLPERYQSRIAPGQGVQVQLDALPGKNFEAKVLAVDPLLDANGRSISVRAAMPRTSNVDLRPGMFARVLIVFSVNDRALVVPEEAMVPQAGKQFVYVVEEQGQGDAKKLASRRVEVEVGVRRGSDVEVVKGLSAGTTVVVAGQQRLQRDGTVVKVVDMARAGQPPSAAGKPAPAP